MSKEPVQPSSNSRASFLESSLFRPIGGLRAEIELACDGEIDLDRAFQGLEYYNDSLVVRERRELSQMLLSEATKRMAVRKANEILGKIGTQMIEDKLPKFYNYYLLWKKCMDWGVITWATPEEKVLGKTNIVLDGEVNAEAVINGRAEIDSQVDPSQIGREMLVSALAFSLYKEEIFEGIRFERLHQKPIVADGIYEELMKGYRLEIGKRITIAALWLAASGNQPASVDFVKLGEVVKEHLNDLSKEEILRGDEDCWKPVGLAVRQEFGQLCQREMGGEQNIVAWMEKKHYLNGQLETGFRQRMRMVFGQSLAEAIPHKVFDYWTD